MINLYPDGRVELDGRDLYVPGSDVIREFHRQTRTPNVLLYGRRGTSKSWSLRWHCHRLCLQYPGFTVLVVRLSKPELQRTWLQYLPAEMETLGGGYSKVEGLATYPNGSTMTLAGFATEDDANKVLGMSIDLLVIEEITQMGWGTITSLASSLRTTNESGRVAQMIAATNPIGVGAAAVKRHWVDRDLSETEEPGYLPDDWLAIPTTAEDNPHLNFADYDKRLSGLNEAKRAAWLRGEWASSEGSFFSEFSVERHVVTRLPELNGRSIFRHPDVEVVRTIDWGYDDPTVCIWLALMPNGQAIAIKEMQWRRTSVQEVVQEVLGHSRDMNVTQTFCDPSMFNNSRAGAQSIGDTFELNGLPLTPSVNDRHLYSVHEYLTTTIDGLPKLQLWAEGVPRLIATLPQQTPNVKDPERMRDSTTDHHVLALSYFTTSWASGHEPLKPEKKPPVWLDKMRQLEAPRVLGGESVKH